MYTPKNNKFGIAAISKPVIIKVSVVPIIILIWSIIFLAILIPIQYASGAAGNFSLTSPLTCGDTCLGSYELSGFNETYCRENQIDCFNTIDWCEDGIITDYEFIDNITATNLNGTNFTAGDTITIDIYADCDSDGDTVSFVYNNGSGFKNLADTRCEISGKNHLYYNTTLDYVVGNHTIRGIIVYDPDQVVSGPICGDETVNYRWTDNDDITMYVSAPLTNNPPTASNPLPAAGTVYEKQESLEIMVCVDATDDLGVANVFMNVSGPIESELIEIYYTEGNTYCDAFANTINVGEYTIQFIVNDSSGNVNDTTYTSFSIVQNSNITLYAPTRGDSFALGAIPLNFTIGSAYENINSTSYIIDDEEPVIIDGGKVTFGFSTSDTDGPRGENNTAYSNISMSFIPPENMSINMISVSLKRNASGTNAGEIHIRNDSSGSPSDEIIATGSIDDSAVSEQNYSFVNITLDTTANLIANTTYWLLLTPNSSPDSPDFYTWESNDDGIFAEGNYSNNASVDLLFMLYDSYKYRTQIEGIERGNHTITVYASSLTMNDIQSASINFSIDYTAPIQNTIIYNPNTSALLDPNVQINITTNITDDLEVQQAIMQYKLSNETDFTNKTASLSNGVYLANFTPTSEGAWIFRIKAWDSSSNELTTGNTTLNITYERGWSHSPLSFNTTSTTLGTNKSIGSIIINNSGDIALTFNISASDGTVPQVYFNNTPDSFLVNANPGECTMVNITITGQEVESEQQIGIIIQPNSSDAIPAYNYTNLTFITFTSGVYLDIQITEYDATVIHGQTRIGLSARITNAGNETANNVTAQWDLPTGWTAKTNLSAAYSSLGVGQQVTFTRYVNIESTAEAGNQTIYAVVNCSEGENDSDSRNVEVSALEDDSEPLPTRSGGGGGGGIIKPKETARINISIPFEIELQRGTNTTIPISITNTGNIKLSNITATIDNYPSMHYHITPQAITSLESGKSASLELFIRAPEYFGSEKKQLTLAIETFDGEKTTTFTKSFTLIIFKEEKIQAQECLKKAGETIISLHEKSISTAAMQNNLKEAQQKFSAKEYSQALAGCNEIISTAAKAEELQARIMAVKQKQEEITASAGANKESSSSSEEVSSMILLAEEAFAKEDYALAERRTEQAEFMASIKEKQVQQTFSYKANVVREHLKEIIIGMIMLAIIGAFAYSSMSLGHIDARLKEADERKNIIANKIKESQQRYFVKKTLPARLYEKEMAHHREALGDIELKKSELTLKRLHIISGRSKKDIEKIKIEAENAKRALQQKYYVDKSIDMASFKKMDSAINSVIQELESKASLEKRK